MTPKPDLRARALQFLARRDHARAELQQKLQRFAETTEELDALLDDFAVRGWLSDARFAEQWTHQRSSRYGTLRLKQELRIKGVGDETIATALEEIANNEESRAREIWQKKFGSPASTPNERAKQARFLATRGFPLDIVYKIIKGCEDSLE